jgi:hypothetical protein
MTIYNLFKNSPFGPEEIRVLASAYEQTVRTLGLKERSDPLTELVAKKIISIAQTGVRDANVLAERAIADLGLPEQR